MGTVDSFTHSESRRYYVSFLLQNSPDRKALIEQFLRGLEKIPFAVVLETSEQLIEQKISSYLHGWPSGREIHRCMALDLRVELSGERKAELFIEEHSDELVSFDFAFDPSDITDPSWDLDKSEIIEGNKFVFREFLLALTEGCPVLIGTLALDLLARDIFGFDDFHGYNLADKLSLEQLAGPIYTPGSDYAYDFAIINPALSGANRPFVYPLIGGPQQDTGSEGEAGCYSMELVENLRRHVKQAEKAYDRMYEANYPLSDRDDALRHLSNAIELAGSLGLVKIGADLKSRYDHIDAVFNAQFRR
jgi:hypothetical protein